MRRARRALASLLLAAAGSAAAPTPSPTPPIYFVVERGGNVVRLRKAPALKGATLVGNLWPGGELVSFRLEDVDLSKTAAANKSGKTATPPAGEKAIGTRYQPAGPQTPLGDRVKLQGGRKEAERKLQSASGTAKPGAEDLPERAEPGARADAAKKSRVVDKDGRGEAYWRGRAKPLRENLADAEAELKIAQDEMRRFEGTYVPPGEGAMSTWALDLQWRRDRVDRAQQGVDASKRRLEELAEEARKADALPGWIR